LIFEAHLSGTRSLRTHLLVLTLRLPGYGSVSQARGRLELATSQCAMASGQISKTVPPTTAVLMGPSDSSLEYYDLVIKNRTCNRRSNAWSRCGGWLNARMSSRPLRSGKCLPTYCKRHNAFTRTTVRTSEPALIARGVIVNNSNRLKLAGAANNEQAIARIEDHLRGGNRRPLCARARCHLPG